MLDATGNRTVTILRPRGLSVIGLYQDALDDYEAETNQQNDDPVLASLERDKREKLDESLDVIKNLITETADVLKLHVNIYEYDFPSALPSPKARRWIGKTNLLTTIEPNDTQLAYVSACLRHNPVMSALLAYDSPDYLEEGNRLHIIDARSVPIINISSPESEKQQRIFASCTHWDIEKIKPVITKALSYPFPVTPPISLPT
ncbi:MAG TPA: hypothetical protein VHA78_05315 [Candidatus Peribacteraceae bacterium]|nr:hypothetical protein [Candidatus Peribacteraceae bacterium]